MNKNSATLLALSAATIAQTAFAADETSFGGTIQAMSIDQHIPPGSLSLRNDSTSKLASRRDLRVHGDNPKFRAVGKVYCKAGARLTAVQVILGNVVINGQQAYPMATHGQSSKLTNIAGLPGTIVDIPVTLNVTRRDTGAAVDLSFNPARTYEQKLKAYVAKGNTAAEYLRETQAFDMEQTVSLVAWCRMDTGTNSVFAGKTYPGVVARKVPVTILYNGDPAIVDGPAARATVKTREADGGPPVK